MEKQPTVLSIRKCLSGNFSILLNFALNYYSMQSLTQTIHKIMPVYCVDYTIILCRV